jgi:hypothetical protein
MATAIPYRSKDREWQAVLSRFQEAIDTLTGNSSWGQSQANTMAHVMDDLASAPSDPDLQATVTDFLDFTDTLPAEVIRSLTLIRQLDETSNASTQKVHELLRIYGRLPSLPPDSRPNDVELRREISYHLARAENARQSSHAEALRLKENVKRHAHRLDSIRTKLLALPKPPSRDPTPAPTSPEIKRSKSGRRLDMPQKLTLKPPNASRHALIKQHRARNNRVTVPGEVLPPINPDSPLASTEISDLESEPDSPIPMPTTVRKGSQKPEKKKVPKLVKLKGPRPPRQPGQGTNVHSQVAGISTANALALLEPPPADVGPGTEWAPWNRLTEYEMALLRKQMKKNAIWTASKTMIRKTLFDRGRGWEAFYKARNEAREKGEPFQDLDNLSNWTSDRVLKPGEIGPDERGDGEAQLSNRGMKLNEAKKRKKEKLNEDNERFVAEVTNDLNSGDSVRVSAANTKLSMLRLEQSARNLKNLNFSSSLSQLVTQAKGEGADKVKAKPKSTPKPKATPKLLPQPSGSATSETPTTTEPSTKKRKIPKAIPAPIQTPSNTITATTTVPILPPGLTTASKASTPLTSPTDSKAGTQSTTAKAPTNLAVRSSVAPKPETPTTSTTPTTRAPSLRRSAAASVEPATATRDHLRRKSATPAVAAEPTHTPKSVPATAASRRSKRPAPGTTVQSTQDGGAAVSVGKRTAAPKKKAAATPVKDKEPKEKDKLADKLASGEEIRIDEDGTWEEIAPDEPRYCVCGDVSFGTMICCENNDVSLLPFHPIAICIYTD